LATRRASKKVFVDVTFGGKPSNSRIGGKKSLTIVMKSGFGMTNFTFFQELFWPIILLPDSTFLEVWPSISND
jgi:hypothetical protein